MIRAGGSAAIEWRHEHRLRERLTAGVGEVEARRELLDDLHLRHTTAGHDAHAHHDLALDALIAMERDGTRAKETVDALLGRPLRGLIGTSIKPLIHPDSGWTAATDAAGLFTATKYNFATNPIVGNFTNGTALPAFDQTYWGVGADSKYFNFGGQDFLLTTG